MVRLSLLLIASVIVAPAMAGATLPYAITPDSEPGWRPTEDPAVEAVQKFGTVLHDIDEGSYDQAYWNYDPQFRATVTQAESEKLSAEGRDKAGSMRAVEPVLMTWTKPRAGAALSGTYLAMDFTETFEKAHRACGYVVMHQPPNGPNWYVLRTEDYYVTDASYDDLVTRGRPDDAKQLWAAIKRNCPNVK